MSDEHKRKKENPDCPTGGVVHHPELDKFLCPGQGCPESVDGLVEPPKCERNEPGNASLPPLGYACNLEDDPPDPNKPCGKTPRFPKKK